jgi:hypothetical protein
VLVCVLYIWGKRREEEERRERGKEWRTCKRE